MIALVNSTKLAESRGFRSPETIRTQIESLRPDRSVTVYAAGPAASHGWRFDVAQDALVVTRDDTVSAWADRGDSGALSVYLNHADGVVMLARVVR